MKEDSVLIIQLDEAKRKLGELKGAIIDLGSALRITELKEKAEELEAKTTDAAFWSDQQNSGKILREIKQLKDAISSLPHVYGMRTY